MKILSIKALLIVLVFILPINATFTQRAEVIYQDPDFFSHKEGKYFELLHHDYDISNHLLIARLGGLSLNRKKKTLDKVYESIVHKANYIGANAFIIDTIIGARTDSIYFEVSIYQLTEAELDMNYDMFTDNTIYLIGELERKKSGGESFKLNAEDAIIKNLEYLEFPLN